MRTRLSYAVPAVLGSLGLAAVLAGCAGNGVNDTVEELAGRTFLSTNVQGAQIPGGGPLRLEFAEDFRIIANAGCNTATGTARLESGHIITGELAMTLIGCPPEVAAADQWLNALFAAEPEWTLEDNRLTLRTDNTRVTLTDRRVLHPDRPLVGTEWVAHSIIEGDVVSTSVDLEEARPTLLIDEDGRTTGSTGCNRFNGSARVDGDEVRFSSLATTRMACPPGLDEVERAVLTALSSATMSVTIEASTLTLINEEGHGLSFRAAE